MRAAVVGAGPAGFFAAGALLRAPAPLFQVDLVERLPTPFGLVRGGVAPDHPSIKAVARVFERTAALPRFRFLGHVEVGRDLLVEELRRGYDAVVFAHGADGPRPLGIEGEALPGCHAAGAFVGWYNGHPDHAALRPNLRIRRAVVVGQGNVALDVARVLARPAAQLTATDLAAGALELLRQSTIDEVVVVGRRGPAQAAFSPAALRELTELEGVDLLVDAAELVLDADSATHLAAAPTASAAHNVALLREIAGRPTRGAPRRLRLCFLRSPRALVAGDDGRVAALRLVRNRLEAGPDGTLRARPTEEHEALEAGLVVTAAGFTLRPVPGLPSDAQRGTVAHERGQVLASAGGAPWPGCYVAGWAADGPRGLIGDQKRAAEYLAARIAADAVRGALAPREVAGASDPVLGLLRDRGVRPVSFADWRRLDRLERERGQLRGAPRDKLVDVEAMLAAMDASAVPG
ncbi:MAG: FAD-dependent oxidoreductase [Proteobacteria bacterium]|nr:FAD-dependent oxidoreductase [Pseudomonadota bacterium]